MAANYVSAAILNFENIKCNFIFLLIENIVFIKRNIELNLNVEELLNKNLLNSRNSSHGAI